MFWKARLDSKEAIEQISIEIPVAAIPPQAVIFMNRVFLKHSEEAGWPYVQGARIIYREVVAEKTWRSARTGGTK